MKEFLRWLISPWRRDLTPREPGLRIKLGVYRTSGQWRADPKAVSVATEVFANDPMTEVLAILANESPMKTGFYRANMKSDEIIVSYGVELGYQICLQKLLSMAETLPSFGEPEPTFKNEEIDE